MANVRIGRIFNQSDAANTVSETNMYDTHTLIHTRRCQAIKSHSNFNCHTLQPLIDNITAKYSTINNNNVNQNVRFFRTDGQLLYHWSADDKIMTTINRREKSVETTELVRRRIELARRSGMRPQLNRGLGREIYVPRRPEENERREN